jgi:oxalate decarboxylase/phosphoglucose isomerase-like protein (cupin superfamily)
VSENYPKITSSEDKPHECFQLAGDIVYIPEGWYHATINCGQTIAVASQIQTADKAGDIVSHFSNAMSNLQNPQVALEELEEAIKVTRDLLESLQSFYWRYYL